MCNNFRNESIDEPTFPMVMATVTAGLAYNDCTVVLVVPCCFYIWLCSESIHDPIVQTPD